MGRSVLFAVTGLPALLTLSFWHGELEPWQKYCMQHSLLPR